GLAFAQFPPAGSVRGADDRRCARCFRPLWGPATSFDGDGPDHVPITFPQTAQPPSPPKRGGTVRVWPGSPHPLGATWNGEGVNFALFSENATAVQLCLFDEATAGEPT